MMHSLSMIAALGRNRALGKGNTLLWRIPDDLKRFKALTKGHPVIMGRKTFESIGRPLSERTNIVITRNADWSAEGVMSTLSLEEALDLARVQHGSDEIFIIGGGEIYALALPHANKLYLTLIEDDKEGDSYFPEYEHLFDRKLSEEEGEHGGLKYRWEDWAR